MRALSTFLLGLTSVSLCGASSGSTDDDRLMPLLLLQMVTQRNDPYAMQSMYPILLSSLMGGSSSSNDKTLYYLLLGAGNDQNMQQWLPLILNNAKSDTDDKLLMMLFMQQQQVTGATDMNNMFPLLLMNSGDDKSCAHSGYTCKCKKSTSDMLLYIMLLNGNNFGPGQQYNNFMFLMFDDKTCDGTKSTDSTACTCSKTDTIKGGIDPITYIMMMQMNPTVKQQLPMAPPQRAIDVGDLLKKQLFANLGPEYAWMANVASDNSASDLMKFQLYQQIGIPPNVMSVLSSGGAKTNDEKFALIQWMAKGSQLSIETMSLMLGIEDSKQFYIHSMIEQGQVDPMTASLLLASQGGVDQAKIKELLIQAATGQIDPNTFATLGKPFVPQLPQGIFPGQDLFFIHLELLDINTCSLIDTSMRKPCGSNYGQYITADQCEVHPYCCYNPYFGSVADIPWCYYNIFFVFHDQYRVQVKEADQFKGPQDCPGLFRYGLNLDPLLYWQASQTVDKTTFTASATANTKLTKLIHYREDKGFPGITEFHCRAILGHCWDQNAGQYPAQYTIPQCYEERAITLNGAASALQAYKPELFKPVVPKEFRAMAGECDTNYFHISTLYYERRACTYSIDMIKYGSEFSPLEEPSRADCLFRLGCCYEDNDQVMQKYSFLPRCYHRVKQETARLVLDGTTSYCGAGIRNLFNTLSTATACTGTCTALTDTELNGYIKAQTLFSDKTFATTFVATNLANTNYCLYSLSSSNTKAQLATALNFQTADTPVARKAKVAALFAKNYRVLDKNTIAKFDESRVPSQLWDLASKLDLQTNI
jgi:hypothetical protein